MILALACATVGIGAAEAQQSKINSGYRVPTTSIEASTDLPQRPDMAPRDGDYSWCDESGGGLECGIDNICGEYESIGESFCENISWNDGWYEP